MTRITITHTYSAPARAVWDVCTDFDALAEVCKPMLTFEGLPGGRVHGGQAIAVQVRVFGKLPAQLYHMEVVEFSDDHMRFHSRERGAGVRNWEHHLRVEEDGAGGARLLEAIDIEAGWKTPLIVQWAKLLYRHRHKGRLRLLAAAKTAQIPGTKRPAP